MRSPYRRCAKSLGASVRALNWDRHRLWSLDLAVVGGSKIRGTLGSESKPNRGLTTVQVQVCGSYKLLIAHIALQAFCFMLHHVAHFCGGHV